MRAALILLLSVGAAAAQAQSLREWFNNLRNPRGELCCHNFDGAAVDSLGWRTKDGGYQLVIDGQWTDVPPDALVSEPNRLGAARVWLRPDGTVRCFIPGPLS